MNIDDKKIIIAKYFGIITDTDGHWYYENVHALKYDDDWNWIINSYNKIRKSEDSKMVNDQRNYCNITYAILVCDLLLSLNAIFEFITEDNPDKMVFSGSDKLSFGKYKGETISDIIIRDAIYMKWVYTNNIIIIDQDCFIQIPGHQIDLDEDFEDFFF